MDREAASRLRKELNALRAERHRIEEDLLECRDLLKGSLVGHTSLRGGIRRGRPAYYLSRLVAGRRRMVYVRQVDLEKARRQVATYRRYQEGLHRLRGLTKEILKAFKELRESEDSLEA
jgi:hypothetical protein